MKTNSPVLAHAGLLMTALLALGLNMAHGQTSTKGVLAQNRSGEQDVRSRTTALAEQVQALIDELSANGISGEDIKVMQTTKAVLSNLTSQEMEHVISSLQKAGESLGTRAGEQNIVAAYGGQKSIIGEFRQILKEYEQREAAYELPTKFKDLTDRQTQIMWTTAQVATDIGGHSYTELDTKEQTTAQIVQSDQDALVNDVATAQQMLDKAAQDATGDEGQALTQAQQDLKDGKLQHALDQANADLKSGHLLQSITEQKLARDQLRKITKDLNPPTSTADALADEAGELAKLIQEQKGLLDQTKASATITPRVVGLDSKQGILVDKTNSLQEDMQALSPEPAGLVKDAITPMQVSRAMLGIRNDFSKAEASQQDAIAKLEAAEGQLQQQVAAAEKAAEDAAKDSTAKLQDLQQKIQAAQQQQQQTTQQTTQANSATPPDANALSQAQQTQTALQQQASAMQNEAAPLSLAASQALANAAKSMAQAQQDMTDSSKAAATQADQQAAASALADANKAVGQQIADNQSANADPTALANAASNLQQAQDAVSSAMADASPSPQGQSPQGQSPQGQSPQGQSPQGQSPQGTPSLAQAEADLDKAAAATQAAAGTQGLPTAAAGAVQDAQKSIAQGKESAKGGDAKGTEAAASAAQASLAQAQAAVAVAQAGMKGSSSSSMAGNQPGKPGQPSSMPGMASNAMMPPSPSSRSMTGAKNISGGSNQKGQLHGVTGGSKYVATVAARDRTSLEQTQGEKRPQEYAPMIDQYLKNLSDQASSPAP